MHNYYGFCEACKDTGHMLLLAPNQTELVSSSRLRVVDVNRIKKDILAEFTL